MTLPANAKLAKHDMNMQKRIGDSVQNKPSQCFGLGVEVQTVDNLGLWRCRWGAAPPPSPHDENRDLTVRDYFVRLASQEQAANAAAPM